MTRAAAVVACAMTTIGWALAAPAGAADVAVRIVGVADGYSPATVTVHPGDAVTWTNDDVSASHNAACDASCPAPFSTGDPGPKGTSGRATFSTLGTYRYHCTIHPNMVGTVQVDPSPAATTTAAPTRSTLRPTTTSAKPTGGASTPTTAAPATTATPTTTSSTTTTTEEPRPPTRAARHTSGSGPPAWAIALAVVAVAVVAGAAGLVVRARR